jgi:hypothetical protein
MQTAWPSQGSASSSTTPLFMMIPYPSSSPIPINRTYIGNSESVVPTIVGGTAVGAISIASVFMVLRYLRPKKKANQQVQVIEEIQEEPPTEIPIAGYNPALAHICVNSSELEEIKQILLTHRKSFRIIKDSHS